VSEPSDVDRELALLETELRRLEAEYNMFFAGRVPRPPWETKTRVDAIVKRIDRMRLSNYGDRFRFTTIQSRYSRLTELWERTLRAREEGRAAPLRQSRSPGPAKSAPAAPAAKTGEQGDGDA
jgi:hypothetical protein